MKRATVRFAQVCNMLNSFAILWQKLADLTQLSRFSVITSAFDMLVIPSIREGRPVNPAEFDSQRGAELILPVRFYYS